MKKNYARLLTVIMCCLLTSCGTSSTYEDTLKQTEDAYEEASKQVESAYKDALKQAEDTYEGILDTQEDIMKSFESGETHTQDNSSQTNSSTISDSQNDNASKSSDITVLESYIGKPLPLFIDKVDQLGYSPTYLAQGVDFTDFIDSLKEDYVTGELDIDENKKTVSVNLILASNIELEKQENALKEKLELSTSWDAAEEYGKDKYGDSFKLNYLTGKIDESIEDENTWFLKAECKLNGQKKTCETKVTGTTEKPKIVFFDIY